MQNPHFSLTPYLLAIAIFGGTFYYGYQKYEVLHGAKEDIKATVLATATAEKNLPTIEDEYGAAQAESLLSQQKRNNELAMIFPNSEEITDLTREFDGFFSKNNVSNNPLFLSNLTFGATVNNEAWDYTILPVKMTIQSSEPNFYKFLDYVENSGSFQNQLRLMAIKTININFTKTPPSPEATTPEVKLLDYTVDLNAFFKKQIEKPVGNASNSQTKKEDNLPS